jgi:hypothetical protein
VTEDDADWHFHSKSILDTRAHADSEKRMTSDRKEIIL